MRILSLITIAILSIPSISHSQSLNQDDNAISIIRYATEFRYEADDYAEFAVNILCTLTDLSSSKTLKLNIPEADKITISQITYAVYDLNDKQLYKRKIRKVNVADLSIFTPSSFLSGISKNYQAVNVEWEYKVILYKPTGTFKWPAILSSFSEMENVSFRLFYDESMPFQYSSNIEVPLVENGSDKSFYLWELKKLTPAKGEFNNAWVELPYVNLIFNK